MLSTTFWYVSSIIEQHVKLGMTFCSILSKSSTTTRKLSVSRSNLKF